MRVRSLLLTLLLVSSASASWFASEKAPDYTDWDSDKAAAYLRENDIPVPSGYSRDELLELVKANYAATATWTHDQLNSAQKAFTDVHESAIDAWDDSQVRQFLVDNGIVAPKSRLEALKSLARNRYKAYSSALSSAHSAASTAISTAIHGDATHQASKSITSAASYASRSATSAAAAASHSIVRAMDETKDYIWSTWSDTELRQWLEDHRFVKTKAQLSREELLQKMKNVPASVWDPTYKAWSDSYLKEWLVDHGVIKSDYEQGRDKLFKLMKDHYYTAQDTVYSAWSDSQLKAWLVEHEVIKSDAELQRDKLLKLVGDHYHHAADTVWAGWHDSEIREWLIENDYLRSDAQVRRDELVKLINEKYQEAATRTGDYLTWPDARLRAYLRNHGVSDAYLPTGRPDLLHEVRIRWVQTTTTLDSVLASIRAAVLSGYETAGEKIEQLKGLLGAGKVSAEKAGYDAAATAGKSASSAAKSASSAASSLSSVASSASAKAEL